MCILLLYSHYSLENCLHNQMELQLQIEQLTDKLEDEKAKHAKWREDNIKRRHNYIPFLVNLLKVLAEKNELLPLLEKAKQKEANKSLSNKG